MKLEKVKSISQQSMQNLGKGLIKLIKENQEGLGGTQSSLHKTIFTPVV